MSLTRTAARTRIRTLVNEPTAYFFTDAEINSWIDDACMDISAKTFCCQARCSVGITTTSGTFAYAFPTTCNSTAIVTIGIKAILNSSGTSLQYVTPDLLGRVARAGEEPMWTEWNDQVLFSPTPTATLTMNVLCWYEQGCTAAGAMKIKTIYHHLVPLYGHYKALQKRRDFASAGEIWKQYETEMARISEVVSNRYDLRMLKVGTEDQVAFG